MESEPLIDFHHNHNLHDLKHPKKEGSTVKQESKHSLQVFRSSALELTCFDSWKRLNHVLPNSKFHLWTPKNREEVSMYKWTCDIFIRRTIKWAERAIIHIPTGDVEYYTHWEVDVVSWCSRLDGQKAGSELPDAPVVVEECETHNHGESKGDGRSYHGVLFIRLRNSNSQLARQYSLKLSLLVIRISPAIIHFS